MVWSSQMPTGTHPDSRRFHGANIIGNTMIIYGGKDAYDQILSDVVCIQINTHGMAWLRPKLAGKSPGPLCLFSMTPVFHPNTRNEHDND